MNESDQKIYKIIHNGDGFYSVTADGEYIAKSITMIGEVSSAIFCDYKGISKDDLFIGDCKVAKCEDDEKILRDLRTMFIGIKMQRGLRDYKICGLSIGECINGS